MHKRNLIILASLLLALAVACGAFGSHGLRARVLPAQLAIWQTAVLYHLFHGLGLLGIALLMPSVPATPHALCAIPKCLRAAAWCLVFGIMLFSGSLYALVLTQAAWLGPLTPIGGVLFIVGWLWLAWGAWRNPTL